MARCPEVQPPECAALWLHDWCIVFGRGLHRFEEQGRRNGIKEPLLPATRALLQQTILSFHAAASERQVFNFGSALSPIQEQLFCPPLSCIKSQHVLCREKGCLLWQRQITKGATCSLKTTAPPTSVERNSQPGKLQRFGKQAALWTLDRI